ncbi:MAG: alpha/beta family hydrolase [Pseudomonadota bacterium]|nr:alpha/beta family hydrolase [Pseudomonadota bacterium]
MINWVNADKPIAQLILAHGAGAGMDSEFMVTMANNLAKLGVTVGLFDFEYMQQAKLEGKKRPPQRAPKLLAYFENILAEVDANLPLFIGGKSMGGRMASMLACEQSVKGVVAFGYPFHPPGKPEKLRIEHFPDLNAPLAIIQGERDTFGKKDEVESYPVCDNVHTFWIPDGDHSLVPRKASGLTQLQNWQTAAEIASQFIAKQL